MADILHRIGTETATPDAVYEALTTVEGLAGWWTDDVRGGGEVGGILGFRFPPVGGFGMEGLELRPRERVAWRGGGGAGEGIGGAGGFGLRPGRGLPARLLPPPGRG